MTEDIAFAAADYESTACALSRAVAAMIAKPIPHEGLIAAVCDQLQWIELDCIRLDDVRISLQQWLDELGIHPPAPVNQSQLLGSVREMSPAHARRKAQVLLVAAKPVIESNFIGMSTLPARWYDMEGCAQHGNSVN